MSTSLATYYAKLLDMPDSEYKVEILEARTDQEDSGQR